MKIEQTLFEVIEKLGEGQFKKFSIENIKDPLSDAISHFRVWLSGNKGAFEVYNSFEEDPFHKNVSYDQEGEIYFYYLDLSDYADTNYPKLKIQDAYKFIKLNKS